MKRDEVMEKFYIRRGFSEEESKEWSQVVGWCATRETLDDEEYQTRSLNLIDSIIHNDKLDYISKLDKIKLFLDTHRSLKSFIKELSEVVVD
jgi:hypothetical protein